MATQSSSRGFLDILSLLFTALTGLYLLIGGAWLLSLGGSAYYVVAGVALLGVTWLLYRRRPGALALYALVLVGTAIWSLFESGPDFWALAPRSGVLVIFGVWLLLVSLRHAPRNKLDIGWLLGALLIWAGVLVHASFNDPQTVDGSLAAATATPAGNENANANADAIAPSEWPAYGRTQEGTRYSPLRQITPENVKNLRVAWIFRTGDMKGPNDPGEITDEVTPIKIGDLLYLCSPHQILFALDAKTGTLKWKFDPQLKTDPTFQHVTCRGVSYLDLAPTAAPAPADAACTRRIYLPVNNGHLYALDALTGERCADFANRGDLDLQPGMPVTNQSRNMYMPTSPPVVTDRVIVVAGSVEDNYSTREPSGVIRGYDVRTGAFLWAFDPGAKDPNRVPGPGEHYSWNSPNSWAPSAYDKTLDIVYVPMGVGTPDIWGGNRTPEQERYASGLLALHASTGKLAWFYQTVHHDLWDMDLPSQPTLVDIPDKNGNIVPVVYVPTKTGNLFVLDRRTGALVVPAPEKPVPQGAAPGDRVSPTQPFSELTYRPTKLLTDADMWGATMYDQLMCRIIFHQLRYEGTFTPPSIQGTLVFPGNLGMFEWGGLAVDTDRKIAIANPISLPFVSRLVPRGPDNPAEPKPGTKSGGSELGLQTQYGTPFGVTLNPFLSPLGLPCRQPAWGYISAIDLRTHQIVWKKRIGTTRDSAPVPLPFKVGMPMLGGPIVTGGGVAFIGATADNYLRAFDVKDGAQLWEARLPAGGQATPMSYSAGGKQYVVIAAGGHGSFGTKLGDYVIAYALP
ncbi:glucose/quinate/shikimate family membrane-bound PQQ-dependent dehydrogenase [Massilia sp.]|uniref:glucose/quinate/shikimate family membrane-bound PQQ-dependent dehydrogenase n=1 Tax=Massilia sp. TaxID=1882437 RepID=UPI0028AA0E07|nr:glucose/quinate/shikimate family membrane-bound PQQ-dependent dehydrogenase [Massilia sp.]